MRQKELEQKQQEMASIVKKLNTQIEELEFLHAQEAQAITSLESICNETTLDITTITGSNGFLMKVGNEVKKQLRVIQNTRVILKAKQLEVQEAYKKVKVLEKLKEKQEKAYYKEFEVKAAKEIDDIVTTRYKVS